MDTGETTDARIAARPAAPTPDEPAYEGPLGRTRLEPVHVTIPGGYVRSVQVYTIVDVTSDPHLRDAATSSALHRFEGGEELAIPFVFHDPDARKLALVLPDSLRHRELVERAKLLEKLAADTEHEIPSYVREARVVIGSAELLEYLAQDRREQDGKTKKQEEELAIRESAVATREADAERRIEELERRVERLTEREKRLKQRAEEVTRREDEHRLALEEIEATQRDQALREQELEGRLAMVQEREQELEGRLAMMQEREHELTSRAAVQPADRPRSVPPSGPASVRPPPPSGTAEVDDDEVEEIDEIEAVSTNSGVQLPDAVEMLDDRRHGGRASASDVEEIVDEDDVEEIEDVDAVREVTGVEAAPEPRTDENEVLEAKTVVSLSDLPMPDVQPPARFLEDREIEMMPVVGDRVWLFARYDEGREGSFRKDGTDLLVQLAMVQGYPVVILALVDEGDDRPYVRRAALDPRAKGDRQVLEALRRSFEATVALFGPEGRFERTVEVSAPRRVNVAMVLERVERAGGPPGVDAATALERALAVPPPVRESGMPFLSEEPEESETAADALEALARLSRWSAPEKIEQAMLQLSVPRDVVDGSMRRVLSDAVEHGLALPPALVSRAVSVGVAAEPGELVQRQIEGFRGTALERDGGGLSSAQVADNWERLLEAAGEVEVAIDGDTHELAWRAIRQVRGDSTGGHVAADVSLEQLPEMGAPELVLLLDHPRARREAALELCRRSDPELLEALFKAVRKMPRAEVVRVVPRLLEFGEVAGDVLIDGLGARKTFVRQASALGLGHLRLRRAVVPLTHLLTNEPSEVWREVARVLGEFGTGAHRALARALKEPRGPEERLAWALAHLANHGCEKQVEQLAVDRDGAVGAIARQGLTLRQDARRYAAQVRGEQALRDEDPVMQFSQRFYSELAGTAPEADLADVTE